MITYAEKLKDPRWQKRRLEILELDHHSCRNCNFKENLQVHHRAYLVGAQPWDYPEELLITLCAKCHHEEEHFKAEIINLSNELSAHGVPYKDIYFHLNILFIDLVADTIDPNELF